VSDFRGVEKPDGTTVFPMENVLPPAVRRLAKQADDAIAAERARRAGTTVVPAEGTPPATTQPPTSAPTPTPTPPAADDWQQKYFSLKGKYDSEVPALNLRARNAEGELARVNTRITQLEGIIAASAPRPAPTPPPTPAAAAEISAEDREQYGEDLINRARAWARAEIAPEIAQLRQQVEQVQGQAKQASTATNQTAVAAHLDRVVPNWATVNEDPNFLQWLNAPAPYSGVPKMKLLRDAHANGNASLVARFFQDYLNEHTATQVPEPTPPHTPSGAGKVSLESLAAPGPGRAASPGAPAAKTRTWTHAQIAAFYSDVRKGKFAGREAEQSAIERDIFAAPAEGRLV
jgi:hypothetical protein